MFGVIIMVLEETFFESVIHGIDSGFAGFVAVHGVDVGFLNEEDDDEEGNEGANDDNFEKGETLFFVHGLIIS